MENHMQKAEMAPQRSTPLGARFITAARQRPIFFVAAGALVIGGGLFLNWPAVVTLGLAPIILALAP